MSVRFKRNTTCAQTMWVHQNHSLYTDLVRSSRSWRANRPCVFVRTTVYAQTMCVHQDHGIRRDYVCLSGPWHTHRPCVFVRTMVCVQTMCSSIPWRPYRPCVFVKTMAYAETMFVHQTHYDHMLNILHSSSFKFIHTDWQQPKNYLIIIFNDCIWPCQEWGKVLHGKFHISNRFSSPSHSTLQIAFL